MSNEGMASEWGISEQMSAVTHNKEDYGWLYHKYDIIVPVYRCFKFRSLAHLQSKSPNR